MEKNDNNNLSELDQLKAQYETLKQQFDQQEILNDRLMKSSIKRSTDFYKRYRTIQFMVYPLMVIVGLLTIKWLFGNNLSLRLFWVVFCVICFVAELWMTKMVRFKTLENNDLLTLFNHARSFKKLYAIFVVSYAVSVTILFVGWLMSEIGSNGYLPNFGAFIIVSCLALVAIVSLGIAEIRYKTRSCDEIIRQIEASDNTIVNKKIGLDRKQKWFCVAMIVAFIGLDVWAYSIVGTRLKLPPMWRTKEYVRAADDLSTEGTLEFWEIYADTLVAEEEAPSLLERWQGNDSIVVKVGNYPKKVFGLNRESDHVWKSEESLGNQVILYKLKKTSPEGPAISAAVLDGKPMVQKVFVNHPRKYPNTEAEPMIVSLTPEASRLWSTFTTETIGRKAALVMDGAVIQEWMIQCGIDNGSLFIMREWSSKEELEAFCEQLIRQ